MAGRLATWNQRLVGLLEIVMLHPGGPEAARMLVHLRYFILGASAVLLAVSTVVWPSLRPFLLQMAKVELVVLAVTLAVSGAIAHGSPALLRRVLMAAFISDIGLELAGLMASGFSNSSFIVVPILTLLSAAVLLGARPAALCAICFAVGYPAAALLVRAGWWPLPADLSWVGDRANSNSQLLLFVIGQGIFVGTVVVPCLWLVDQLRVAYRDYHGRHATAVQLIEVEVQRRHAERSAAAEALRTRERHYQLLADNVSDLVTLCTPTLEITFVSPSAERVIGVPAEELLGQSLRALVHPEDLAEFTRALEEYQRNGEADSELLCEFRVRHRDGRWRWLETRGRLLAPAPGEAGGLVLSSRDVSQRRALEATMLQAQKLESLGLLAGGVAHDFNNILTSILGNAELAKRWLSPASAVLTAVDKIARAATRAADLCKQMMSYAGSGSPTLAPVDLNQVIREIPTLLGAAMPDRAALTYDLDPELPPVEADAAQIRQVAMNLVMNAAEALEDQPGRVTVTSGVTSGKELPPVPPEWHRVQPLAAAPATEYVFVRVTDTGGGMDRPTVERIFDPFFTTKFTGRGLGLSSLLGIARTHRGFVTVATRAGHGTAFTVGFPAVAPGDVAEPAPAPRAEWRGSGRVLVVDDEDDVLEFVQQAFALMGFEVLTASNAPQAVELFRRHAEEIVFVMCDVAMPTMPGDELVAAIRTIRPGVQVALMSGFSCAEVQQRLGPNDAVRVIQKPFSLDALRAAAQELLAGARPS